MASQQGDNRMPEAIIETAIGLFLVFTVMSLVASQVVEWLASLGHWRADNLEQAIRSMLSDPDVKAKVDQGALVLADKLYEHPLIASLAQPGSKPSYIPAGKFALALFDVITTAGTDISTIGRARRGLEQVKNQLLAQLSPPAGDELQSLINQLQVLIEAAGVAHQTAEAIASLPLPPLLNDELNGFLKRYDISSSGFSALAQSLGADSDMLFTQVLDGAARLSKLRPELAQLVTSLFSGIDMYLSEGEPRLAAARRNVEQWFNDAMDRAGGWYKRHTQLWLGLIGFLFALALNVDTVTIATALWRDPTLRQNVVEQAQKYELPAGGTGQPLSSSETAQAIRDLNTNLSQELRLPIGWRIEYLHLQATEVCTVLPQRSGDVWGIPSGADCIQVQEAVPNPNAGVLGKLVGFLITAVAVTQGAPFWFNLLQNSLRLAGKKPEEEKPAGK
jgi:hypothetical protein